jgi:hypothetical protein
VEGLGSLGGDVGSSGNDNASSSSFLEFLSRHLGALTAIATVLSATFAMAFLFSFLSVFDWTLIWIIEYTDIIKFGLISFALVSGYTYFTLFIFRSAKAYRQDNWYGFGFLIAFVLLVHGVRLYHDVCCSVAPAKEYHILQLFSWVAVIVSARRFVDICDVCSKGQVNARQIATEYVFVICLCVLFGRTYGLYLRDNSTVFHDVAIKRDDDVKIFRKAKILLVTSHHFVITGDDRTAIIPSGDVVEVDSATVSH